MNHFLTTQTLIAAVGSLVLFMDCSSEAASVHVPAPVRTDSYTRAFTYRVPAPRGRILDRSGHVFATTRTSATLGIKLLAFMDVRVEEADGVDPGDLIRRLEIALEALRERSMNVLPPSEAIILEHWEKRPLVPLRVTAPLSWEQLSDFEVPEWAEIETVYLRDYPEKEVAAHVLGYVSRETPRITGEFVRQEYLWPTVKGRSGLEKTYDETLRGSDGIITVLRDRKGNKLSQHVLREPQPGRDLVTTLSLPLQRLAANVFQKSGRHGAFVAVDSGSGDVVAMQSSPSFDPNRFVPSISADAYRELEEHPSAPLYARAWSGVYPPGSIFKPLVALAGLRSGAIRSHTRFPGAPSIEIAGREFHNWNQDEHEGNLTLEGALKRSTNTWFYQAGLEIGKEPMLDAARAFGYLRGGLGFYDVTNYRTPFIHVDTRGYPAGWSK